MTDLITPLLIDANATREFVAALLKSADRLNTSARTRNKRPPIEWVVVRRTVGFEIRWYLLRLPDAEDAVSNSADAHATAFQLLHPQEHQTIPAIQLDELNESTSGPAMVMTGERVLGLIEPVLRAAASGGSHREPSRGESARATRRSNIQPAPAVRVAAAAFIGAPRRVQPNKKFRVEIGLSETPPPGVENAEVVVGFQEGEQEITLDIHVEAQGFTCETGFDHSLTVSRHEPYQNRVRLWLAASELPQGAEEELRSLQVLYACRGLPCGSATYRILVQQTDVPVELPPPTAPAARVQIDTAAPSIDLTLSVMRGHNSDATATLTWSASTPHAIAKPVGSMTHTSTELATLPIEIVDALAGSDGLPGIGLLVNGIAGQVADEIPGGVWEVLRNVTAAVRTARGPEAIPTVLLKLQETRVPWELALMPEPLPDPARPAFLFTQYIVTRWLLEGRVPPVPPYEIAGPDIVAIFGDYSKATSVAKLPFARKEADYLQGRAATVLDATRNDIVALLEDRATDSAGKALAPRVVHFAGHGEAGRSTSSFMVLNDGTTLIPSFFREAPVLKKHHPFVFLNACQLGAAAPTLGQPGGFAAICIHGECSGAIAPLWSVNDEVAFRLATAFYDDVFGAAPGATVAEAMFALRQTPYTDVTVAGPNNTTVTKTTASKLAYIIYGHPALRLR
jgi:hypothetical protein